MPTELTAADGHVLSAYTAGPQDAARGLVVVRHDDGDARHPRGSFSPEG